MPYAQEQAQLSLQALIQVQKERESQPHARKSSETSVQPPFAMQLWFKRRQNGMYKSM